MITNKSCRSLLLRYIDSRRRKKKPLDREEFEELMNSLQGESPAISNLIQYVQESSEIDDHQYAGKVPSNQLKHQAFTCPPVWAPFLESLAVSTPVCSFIHQDEELLLILEQFLASKGRMTSEWLLTFREKFPVFHSLIVSFPEFKCPEELFPVIEIMIERSKAPFRTNEGHSESLRLAEDDEVPEEMYSHWPGLNQVRRRGKYVVDDNAKSKRKQSCHKMSSGHPTLLPGVFTMFCQHGEWMFYFIIDILALQK